MKDIYTDWTTVKNSSINKQLPLQYIEYPTNYLVYVVDAVLAIYCQLDKNPSDTTDLDDFINNYKSTANTNLTNLDTDGAQIVRIKAAKKGWTYGAIPFEFQTARLSDTLYAKLSDGTTDRAGFTMKVYNASGTEVTTAGALGANYSTITTTIIDYEPAFDYEIIGGALRTSSDILQDLRLWIIAVPDIPAGSGGSKEMAGGINLRYLAPGNVFEVDGRVSKSLTYNAVLHTNKLRFILRYPAGLNETLSITMDTYRA